MGDHQDRDHSQRVDQLRIDSKVVEAQMKDQPLWLRDSGLIIALLWLFVIAVMVTFIVVARVQ